MKIESNSLVRYEGFDTAVFKMYGITENWQDAYEAIETVYYDTFGTRKYKDYHSYRVCKNRRLKKQQKCLSKKQ